MSKYIYLCKYLFLGKRMVNSQILVILNGVKSAVVALGRYARAVKPEVGFIEDYVHIVQNSELVASVLFFMNTLSISHPKLEKTTRDMQKVVGIACLRFLGNYAELLIAAQGRTPVAMLSDLYVPAQATVQVWLVFAHFTRDGLSATLRCVWQIFALMDEPIIHLSLLFVFATADPVPEDDPQAQRGSGGDLQARLRLPLPGHRDHRGGHHRHPGVEDL
jgi:hypothetical protein